MRVRAGVSELAIPLSELDAVIECPPLAPVPSAPPWLVGVGGRKGRVLPVADLGLLLDGHGDRGAASTGDRLLLVESGAHLVAFAVSRILSESLAEPSGGAPQIALRALAARLLKAEAASAFARGAARS